ncbi:hypothetical protein Tco_0089143 [Tanacetum coccineum]
MKTTSKASKLDYRIQQQSKGSSEGYGIILEVPDKPKDISGSLSSLLFASDDETKDISSDKEIKADENKAKEGKATEDQVREEPPVDDQPELNKLKENKLKFMYLSQQYQIPVPVQRCHLLNTVTSLLMKILMFQ